MKYFGTDGFRGEANRQLTAAHAYRIGRFLGHYFYKKDGARPRIVIGKDTRRSSYMLENALAAGLVTSGADTYLLHVTTTPSVSYIVRTEDFDCGIMISASHNPFYDNGIKLIDSNGAKMDDSVLQEIEAYIDAEEDYLPLAERERVGMTKDFVFGRNQYIGYLITTVRRSFKGKRIGLDCANGAAFTIAKSVFDALGAETLVIHDKPDGLNINVNCGSTHIEDLVELVKREHLDAGFAFDGDADRCIAVDNRGEVMDGDCILYICGSYLKQAGDLVNNTIVTTVMSNFGLYKALERVGIDYVQTAVGDKYVAANMAQTGNCIGGEQSGHIIFSKYATTGDGILTALRMMEVMLEAKSDFASLHRDLIIYPQILKNVRVVDKNEVLDHPSVRQAIAQANEKLGNDGRTLVRPSGTEPVLRVMAEARQEGACAEAVDAIIGAIRDAGLLSQ
ncbi:MAG: phosphoglucosamine mutase [Ndongobacter sp.]|nr:phosphoglucosamine mutase [Ndongobacter sp.]